MEFKKKDWKDRLVEFAGRRMLTRVSGSVDETMVVDVARAEGTISQPGDAFSAANMNDLEQRIGDGFAAISQDLNGFSFGMTSDGEPGFRKPGADTVTPFYNGLVEYIDGGMNRKALAGSTASVSGSYTATSKGTIIVFCSVSYINSGSDIVKLNGTKLTQSFAKTAYKAYISLYVIPVKKNDIISISVTSVNKDSNEAIHSGYFMAIAK